MKFTKKDIKEFLRKKLNKKVKRGISRKELEVYIIENHLEENFRSWVLEKNTQEKRKVVV